LRRSFLRSAPERRCDPFTSTAFLNIVPCLRLPLALTYNRPPKNSDTLWLLLSTEDFCFSLQKISLTLDMLPAICYVVGGMSKVQPSQKKVHFSMAPAYNTTLIPSTDLHPAPSAWRSSRAGPRKISQPTLNFFLPLTTLTCGGRQFTQVKARYPG
jgi:hypothetical protein